MIPIFREPARHAFGGGPLILLLVCSLTAAGQSATVEEIEAKLPLIDDHIARLAQAEPWIASLGLIVLLAGLASAVVAAFDGAWVKRIGIILGAVVASVSGYRASTFGLDAQTCELVRKKAENSLRLVRLNVNDFRKTNRNDRIGLALKFKAELDQLEPLMEKVGRPLFALSVVRAQSVEADTRIQAQGWGFGRCDNEAAAFDLARHDALDRLARSAIKNTVPAPNLIIYLRERATVVAEKCAADKEWSNCEVRLEVPRIYLNPDIVASLQKREPEAMHSSFTDRERHVFLANNDAFGVDGKSQTGEKFDFRLRRSKSLDGSWTVRVEQIKLKGASGDPKDWLLQFSIDGRTAALPYGSYGQSGVETRCDVSSMLREVTIPKGGVVRDVVVRGYRP